MSQDTTGNDLSPESSDNNSFPDVHWWKAFLLLLLVLVARQTEGSSAIALGAC
jgi:hypothetical protein